MASRPQAERTERSDRRGPQRRWRTARRRRRGRRGGRRNRRDRDRNGDAAPGMNDFGAAGDRSTVSARATSSTAPAAAEPELKRRRRRSRRRAAVGAAARQSAAEPPQRAATQPNRRAGAPPCASRRRSAAATMRRRRLRRHPCRPALRPRRSSTEIADDRGHRPAAQDRLVVAPLRSAADATRDAGLERHEKRLGRSRRRGLGRRTARSRASTAIWRCASTRRGCSAAIRSSSCTAAATPR